MPSKTVRTISDVRQLGYEVGFAHGSVVTEQEALEAAREAAKPAQVRLEAEPLIDRAIDDFAALMRGSADYDAQLAWFTAKVHEQIPRLIGQGRQEAVEHHERAVGIAQSMPDVWVVSGPGISNIYVACSEDGEGADEVAQEMLDSLCNADAHAERSFQHHAPDEVVATVLALRKAGENVEGKADDKGFSVTFGGKSYRTPETFAKAAKAKLDN